MKIKYPRSFHIPYSENCTTDDKMCKSDAHFENEVVVGTIKMDGENTTIYNDYIHARSLSSNMDTEDRRWIDTLRLLKIRGNISETQRIVGENLFYKHTCNYNSLLDFFYMFSLWDGDVCLSWEETKNIANKLNLVTVPEFYYGIYDKDKILKDFDNYIKNSSDDVEGFVIRKADSFNINDFSNNLNKFVRKTFIIPQNHWRHSKKEFNKSIDGVNPWEKL